MTQPEAKFKRQLIESFEKYVPNGWFTYIAPSGLGQKPGMPDLLFGVPGSMRPLLWVEVKMPGRKLRSSQVLTLNRLLYCAALVRVVYPRPSPNFPNGASIYMRPTPDCLSGQPIRLASFKTTEFWDRLWKGDLA